MRVAVVTNLYPPFVRGGAEYLASQVVQELHRQGHQVVVVTSAPWRSLKSYKPQLREESGVRVWRFYPLNIYHYLNARFIPYPIRFIWQVINLWNWSAAHTVIKILHSEQPEVVVSFNLMGLSYLLPRALAKAGFKEIHTLHDVQLLHPSGLFLWSGSGKQAAVSRTGALRAALVRRGKKWLTIPSRLYQLATRRLFRPVPVVVSPSQWLLDEHQKRRFFQQSKAVVLPNPVPPVTITPTTKTTQKPLKLAYVGQFEKHKGVLWLAEVMRSLPRHDFVLQLLPLGQKPRTKELKKILGNDVRFVIHDIVTQADIDHATEQSHLILVPSLCYENSPTAIVKALAAGTPVLASRLGGIPELVDEGVTGWLFTPGDNENFTARLNWCLDHPHELLQAGLQGSRAFAGRTLEQYVKQLIQL